MFTPATAVQHRRTNVVVVGSGVAGMTCALALAPVPVMLLTKTPGLLSGSSLWAKGGIAAAIGAQDSPDWHAADTVAAGAGLSDRHMAGILTHQGSDRIRELSEALSCFDRNADGTIALGREAAHSTHRIVHAGGDAIGLNLVAALARQVAKTPSIRVVPDCFLVDLVKSRGRVRGVLAWHMEEGWVQIHANQVVLATGGIGALWLATTNPPEATGDGLAAAARAGARLADLEFVQFHPTALVPRICRAGLALPLLTEALRGAGAVLTDADGKRFMRGEHPLAELAPRDVVARAIARRTQSDVAVYLDLRPAIVQRGRDAFPQALLLCREAGYDPLSEPVPVTPAAHYAMGGILTDEWGRASLDGLWACGEVASTGVHGANRLASNSLLEGLVFGNRVADGIRGEARREAPVGEPQTPRRQIETVSADELRELKDAIRRIASSYLGILRNGDGIAAAAYHFDAIEAALSGRVDRTGTAAAENARSAVRAVGEVCNMLLIGRLVAFMAGSRTESRGAHFRSDYPQPLEWWGHRQIVTIDDLQARVTNTQPVVHAG